VSVRASGSIDLFMRQSWIGSASSARKRRGGPAAPRSWCKSLSAGRADPCRSCPERARGCGSSDADPAERDGWRACWLRRRRGPVQWLRENAKYGTGNPTSRHSGRAIHFVSTWLRSASPALAAACWPRCSATEPLRLPASRISRRSSRSGDQVRNMHDSGDPLPHSTQRIFAATQPIVVGVTVSPPPAI
jgi:hypothetical protein